MGMSLSFGYSQRYEQRHSLSVTQKFGLQQLLLLEQKLKHPDYSNAARGLEGMQTAHEILKERGVSGVLIGGLAEEVWNQRRKPEDLYRHKDVDVAVLDDYSDLSEDFEGGVDWWIPQNGRITVRSSASGSQELAQRWYENSQGIVLSFGIKRRSQLSPGLYIPDSEWVVDMREYEAEANIDSSRVDVDSDVFEKFRDKVRERVKTRLPKFIRQAFAGYILSEDYGADSEQAYALELERFGLDKIITINTFKSGNGRK